MVVVWALLVLVLGSLGPIAAIAVFRLYRAHQRLSDRVDSLEQTLASARTTPSAAPGDPAPVAEPSVDSDAPLTVVPGAFVGPPRRATWAGPDRPVQSPGRAAGFDALLGWLRENWVLTAGAVSLAFAGVFLVQYGAEHGYLTPTARVWCAMALGALLVGGGEALRRRHGDDTEPTTRFLPSALAGAGVFTLFAAVLAARGLYQLIEPLTALIALASIAAAAVLLGWFYGPFLSAVGIVGALIAPYLVGGRSDTPWVLSYYFAALATTALAIDSIKRYAWLAVIGLGGATVSVWTIYLTSGFPAHFLIASGLLAGAALTVPSHQLRPTVSGSPVSGLAFKLPLPGLPVWLGWLAVANASAAAVVVGVATDIAHNGQALIALAVTLGVALFWTARSTAFIDLALWPCIAFVTVVALQPQLEGGLYSDFTRPLDERERPAATVWAIVAVALLTSVLGFVRQRQCETPLFARLFCAGSAAFTVAVVFALEWQWLPAAHYGSTHWALGIAAAAAGVAILSRQSAHQSVADAPMHAALYSIAALTLLGLSLFVAFTHTALTLGLAVLTLAVTVLDRRFALPLLPALVKVGVLIVAYRAVVDPGVTWATRTFDAPPVLDVLLAYVGPLLVLGLARATVRTTQPTLRVSIACGMWSVGAAGVFVVLVRLLPGRGLESHWGMGLLAALWLVACLAQLRQLSGAGRFEQNLRGIVACALGALVVGAVAAGLFGFNPLTSAREAVVGPPVLNSLALAYLPVAAVLGLAGLRLETPWRHTSTLLLSLASGFALWYLALAIRHVWQGPNLSQPGVLDGELYSYTLAMMVIAVGLLTVAFLRRNARLRTVAMAAVGVTIGKVFLIDMADLTGLIRVLSFLGLGLALIGLTWLSRVMDAQWGTTATNTDDGPEPAPG
ncbi:MAG: DUF2339 domain-containing protein [Pseudomonadota bacterium]